MVHSPTLSGLTVINTRPAAQAAQLSLELSRLGASVLEVPALEITSASPASFVPVLRDAGPKDLIILTSRNSCLALATAFSEDPEFAARFRAVPVACVGSGTAGLAREIGCNVQVVSDEANWEGLAATLLDACKDARPRIFAVRGATAGRDLPAALREHGFPVEEIAVYLSTARSFTQGDRDALNALFELQNKAYVLTVFSSPAGVKAFMHEIKQAFGADVLAWFEQTRFAALGRKTAQSAAALGLSITVCSENSSLDALVAGIEEFYNKP